MSSLWAYILAWRSRIRLVSRGTSVGNLFGSPFSSKAVVCGHCPVTLSVTINETLKWLPSLPILIHESFWWWQFNDKYNYNLILPPPPYPLPPFSPSLISLTVCVDVKHHVYLLTCWYLGPGRYLVSQPNDHDDDEVMLNVLRCQLTH